MPDPIVREAWQRGVNSPRSSAAGRVFDAMAAIVLGVAEASFEGQGPMWLEAQAGPAGRVPALARGEDGEGLPRIDWSPLIGWCADARRSVAERASAVHLALADAICGVAVGERERSGATVAGLTGGVFQNRLLAELASAGLARRGFRVLLPERIPCNDGGLAYGQVAEHLGRTPVDSAHALVRTTVPWSVAPRVRGRHAFRGRRRRRGHARGARRPCQLYVHVPFCEVLCPFCSFHRVRYDAPKSGRYFEALRREIRLYHEAGFRFSDVYVGGGTPTVHPEELLSTLALVRSLSPVRTISIETNPNHLDPALLARYAEAGVTRLSVGVQSFDDGLLTRMERLAKYGNGEQIRRRLAAAQGVFPTLNVDMIFNLPGQTPEMLDRDLDCLLALGVDQVSFYPLMTAPTARHKMERTMGRADESLRFGMYQTILGRMLPAYRASSAWCFSRGAGMFDEYIIDQHAYVGVGSGAFSYVGGAMYSTTFSLNHYCRRVEGGQSGITQRRMLGAKERMRYDFLVRLFGGELRRDWIERRYGRGVLVAHGTGAGRDADWWARRGTTRMRSASRGRACTAGC